MYYYQVFVNLFAYRYKMSFWYFFIKFFALKKAAKWCIWKIISIYFFWDLSKVDSDDDHHADE